MKTASSIQRCIDNRSSDDNACHQFFSLASIFHIFLVYSLFCLLAATDAFKCQILYKNTITRWISSDKSVFFFFWTPEIKCHQNVIVYNKIGWEAGGDGKFTDCQVVGNRTKSLFLQFSPEFWNGRRTDTIFIQFFSMSLNKNHK